ncbi:MAG TPA: endopeptidase, partial [Vicinamibacteria bacterium]|nr:endopeptidase [Vicinamibacteria bacterium]
MDRTLPAALLLCSGWAATPARAAVVPTGSRVAEKSFRQEALEVKQQHRPLSALPSLAAGLEQELTELGVRPDQGFFDPRVGRWSSLILSRPLIPGTGVGTGLRWEGEGAADEARIKARAWNALRGFLQEHEGQLRVNVAELSAAPRIDVFEHGTIVFIHAPRVVGGLPVRDASLTAAVNHGNLVLLGLQNWADVTPPAAAVGADAARARVAQHVSPFLAHFGPGRLEVIPTVRDGYYDMRLAWVFQGSVAGDNGTWEGIVDAVSGDLLAFEDRNHYAQRTVLGGVYPVSNDQRPPDGIEQTLWPMPFANVVTTSGTVFTSHGGTLACTVTGNVSTTLAGQFVRINDSCGAINESGIGNLDLGSGPTPTATDCTVPAGHSVGDTKSARSGFYELNRIKEQARAYLPTNTWLQGQLPANMNLPMTCNAFWSTGAGTVNFYRDSGSQCRNTGEIAAIFDHEWGHGMDANGTAGGVSSPGEGIADIHAFLRLQTSCIGRGFWKNQVCGGYGDGCNGTPTTGCTGIRDIDYTQRRCNRPH